MSACPKAAWNDKTKAFVAAYKAKHNADPSGAVMESYDGAWLLFDAIKTAGGTEAKAIINALENTQLCRRAWQVLLLHQPRAGLALSPVPRGAAEHPAIRRGEAGPGRCADRLAEAVRDGAVRSTRSRGVDALRRPHDRLPADPGAQRAGHRRHLRGHRRRPDGDLLDPEDRQLRARRSLHDGRLLRAISPSRSPASRRCPPCWSRWRCRSCCRCWSSAHC